MKLLTTLFKIQSGEIFLNDLNYKKDLKEIRKNLGYLPQNFCKRFIDYCNFFCFDF